MCTPRNKGLTWVGGACRSPNSVSAKKTEDSSYLDCSKEFFEPEFKRIVLVKKECIQRNLCDQEGNVSELHIRNFCTGVFLGLC